MKAFILSILLDLLKYLFILMLIIPNLSHADLYNNSNNNEINKNKNNKNVETGSVQLAKQVLRRPPAL